MSRSWRMSSLCLCALVAVGCAADRTNTAPPTRPSPADAATAPDADAPDAPDAPDADPSAADAGADAGAPLEPLASCLSAPSPPDAPEQDWEHTRNEIVTLGSDEHTSQDTLAVTTKEARIEGKFAYGAVSKDLEDEWVEVFLDDCSGAFVKLGERLTDSDGRVAFSIAPEALPTPGTYAVYLRVKGDQTSARSVLRVFPEGTRLMVFDIDGTLTTKDSEIFGDAIADFFEPIYSGDVVPEARPKAAEITTARAAQGYQLVYLTGRPYVLTRITREWLITQGFAPGTVHVTNSNREVLPNDSGVGEFKRGYLLSLKALGLEIEAAYGNAETDIFAYAGAGVPPARTYIAGEFGGDGGTQAVGDGYESHLPVAAAEPDAAQPFAWP